MTEHDNNRTLAETFEGIDGLAERLARFAWHQHRNNIDAPDGFGLLAWDDLSDEARERWIVNARSEIVAIGFDLESKGRA